jgi:hypothetical protein
MENESRMPSVIYVIERRNTDCKYPVELEVRKGWIIYLICRHKEDIPLIVYLHPELFTIHNCLGAGAILEALQSVNTLHQDTTVWRNGDK